MTFSEHLVKKGALNMFHLHITKALQKKKKVSYQLCLTESMGLSLGCDCFPA